MSEILEYKLEVSDRTLSFKVLSQDAVVYDFLKGQTFWHKDLEVMSVCFPEISKYTIFLRGDERAGDDDVATLSYNSKSQAEEAFIRYDTALKALIAAIKEA